MTNLNIGNLGELLVLQELTKRGIQCYLPYGNGSRVDLVAEFNGTLNKIQIKTCEKVSGGVMTWKVGGGKSHRIYSDGEIDYFALCCIENSIVCFVPFNNQTSSIAIRPDDYMGARTYNMRFVSDYSLDKILKTSCTCGGMVDAQR